jgi:hypothetical protein
MKFTRGIAAGIAALAFTAGAASAATMTIEVRDDSKKLADLTCVSCMGVDKTGTLGSIAYAFPGSPADTGTVVAQFNSILTNVVASSATKIDVGNNTTSFNVGGGYFFTKYGNNRSFFFADGAQTIGWNPVAGTGSGLSNWGEIDTSVIPLPAAGWLLLAGLGGLAAMGRRKAA